LSRAHVFFQGKFYRYLEVPWAVPISVVATTIPPEARPLCLADSDSVLIGSAEQGIIDLVWNSGFCPRQGEKYFAVSPCFRGEHPVTPGITQLTFMKVELFSLSGPGVVETLVNDAEEFMTGEGAVLSRVETPDGMDLYCGGLEVGSYGARSVRGLHWSYGTGLAEPRFNTSLRAMRLQQAHQLHRDYHT
jgi:hypothetical protein